MKTLRLAASSTAARDAVIQMPRPGSLRLTSGITWPVGSSTKRIISETGLSSRVSAQVRSVSRATLVVPRSSSLSRATANITATVLPLCLRLRGFLGDWARRRRELRLRDPAGLEARLHDHGLCLLARNVEAFEEARLMLRLAILALGPSDQIVGRAAGEIFDGFHGVLAQGNHNLGGDARHILYGVFHAELLTLGIELSLLRRNVFLRTLLKFACSVFIESLDGRNLLLIDQREFFDRTEAFRSQQLANHFVEVERLDENLSAVLELGLTALRLFLLS